MGTTVGVQLLLGAALGVSGTALLLHVLLGSLLAMNMATVIRQGPRRDTAVTAAWAPAAAALGAVLATITAPVHWLALGLFVVISGAAVWVRRFGGRWFAGGFIVWQAYFFTLYLHPPPAALPGMLVAVAVSGAWVTLLLLTVLHADPERTLRRTVTALRARARSVVSHCLDLLREPDESGAQARMTARIQARMQTQMQALRRQALRTQLIKLSEVALLFDGQLEDPRALPEGFSATGLRRWIVHVEISCEELANAAVTLAAPDSTVPADTVASAEQMLEQLGWGELEAARKLVQILRARPHDQFSAVRRLARAAETLLSAIEDWNAGRLSDQEPEGDYEPVVGLVGGALPGIKVASEEGSGRLTAPRTWSTTSRQAAQAAVAAALAIVAGELISSQRFYWAVIAAFVAFTGTATSGETVRKSVARTAGTLAGLVVAVGVAQLTVGHPLVSLVVLLACIFCAFYLQALSYAAMIFFITLMLGELYGILNRFSDTVLLVRLAETAAGAAAGILVALLVLPTRTRPTLMRARRLLLEDLAGLVEACALRLQGEVEAHQLLTDAIRLDEAARQVVRSADSWVRVPGLDRDQRGRRHRVAVLGVCSSAARSLVPAVLAAPARTPPEIGQACRLVAAEARRLADVPDLRDLRPAADTPDIAAQVGTLLEAATDPPVVLTRRLQRLADALAVLVPRGGGH